MLTSNEIRAIIGNPRVGDTLALNVVLFHDIDFARQVRTTFGTTTLPIHLDEKPVIFGPLLKLAGRVPLLGMPAARGELEINFGSPVLRLTARLTTPAASLKGILDPLLGGLFALPPLLDAQTEPIDLTLQPAGSGAARELER